MRVFGFDALDLEIIFQISTNLEWHYLYVLLENFAIFYKKNIIIIIFFLIENKKLALSLGKTNGYQSMGCLQVDLLTDFWEFRRIESVLEPDEGQVVIVSEFGDVLGNPN